MSCLTCRHELLTSQWSSSTKCAVPLACTDNVRSSVSRVMCLPHASLLSADFLLQMWPSPPFLPRARISKGLIRCHPPHKGYESDTPADNRIVLDAQSTAAAVLNPINPNLLCRECHHKLAQQNSPVLTHYSRPPELAVFNTLAYTQRKSGLTLFRNNRPPPIIPCQEPM